MMSSRLATKTRKAYRSGPQVVVLTNFWQGFLPENRLQAPSILGSSSGSTGWQRFSWNTLKSIQTFGFATTHSLWICLKKAIMYILQPLAAAAAAAAAAQPNSSNLSHSLLWHATAHRHLSEKVWAFSLKVSLGKTGDSLPST